ncbi:MAG: hypothetical protein M1830_007784 [Pleopsidium flavum]|nr:MAG: hypothetical protein M1830_007784 [Pleopsidium flavum]
MLINKDVAVATNSILLVPYSQQHVLTYHEWMKDKVNLCLVSQKRKAEDSNQEIQQATASEPLSLEEEYDMQHSWRNDTDKLTFITCLPASSERAQAITGKDDAPAKMLGDVNLFLTSAGNDEDGNKDSYTLVGEIELMIATKENQGRGYGRATLLAFMEYLSAHQKDILDEYDQGRLGFLNVLSRLEYLRVKIAESNERSIRLFESMGFSRVSDEANYFDEIELRLVTSLSETLTSLREKYGSSDYREPNFLHAGDHVHLGPGVTGTRKTDPAVDLHDLPNIDVVLLSHYHEDHFDKHVEASLRRDLPIISTPHAKAHLEAKEPGESFSNVYELDFFDSMVVDIVPGLESKTRDQLEMERTERTPSIKVTGMPGKHVPDGVLGTMNEYLQAVPPTNGWMVELGYGKKQGNDEDFECGYRIYISGDTLMVDELKQIPERYKGQNIDLMLIHLGGTTIPSPSLPLLMVTMDAKQGLELVQLINPDLTIPIHFDDYDVFLSPLSDFKKAMEEAGLSQKVVYLDRKDQYKFNVKRTS